MPRPVKRAGKLSHQPLGALLLGSCGVPGMSTISIRWTDAAAGVGGLDGGVADRETDGRGVAGREADGGAGAGPAVLIAVTVIAGAPVGGGEAPRSKRPAVSRNVTRSVDTAAMIAPVVRIFIERERASLVDSSRSSGTRASSFLGITPAN